MDERLTSQLKSDFEKKIKGFVDSLTSYANDSNKEWVIKGFIDVYKNIYPISFDSKVVSKILEIHLLPQLLKFTYDNGYRLILASRQNYYPDFSIVSIDNESIKFALDVKTTYRLGDNSVYCNGFTLGSHGEYFVNRRSDKNVQFPYGCYLGHYCLCVIYERSLNDLLQSGIVSVHDIDSITSVIRNLNFFIAEKWKIASDKSGSGNTANIGSVKLISQLISQQGPFAKLGEKWFDDYWKSYGKITIEDSNGNSVKIRSFEIL